MDKSKINEYMAEKVMGWKLVEYQDGMWWQEAKEGHIWRPYSQKSWIPDNNIDQAMWCAEEASFHYDIIWNEYYKKYFIHTEIITRKGTRFGEGEARIRSEIPGNLCTAIIAALEDE